MPSAESRLYGIASPQASVPLIVRHSRVYEQILLEPLKRSCHSIHQCEFWPPQRRLAVNIKGYGFAIRWGDSAIPGKVMQSLEKVFIPADTLKILGTERIVILRRENPRSTHKLWRSSDTMQSWRTTSSSLPTDMGLTEWQ